MSIPKPAFSMEPNSYMKDASVSPTGTELPACTSSVEYKKRLDAICTAFEQQWGNPDTASIETLVNAAEPSERESLFDELISIEQEMLGRRGQPVDRQHYFKRFPAYQSRLNIIFARLDSETLPKYSLTAESDSRYV